MPMKLYYSPTSPFVRKVTVSALELGLDGEIERMPAQVSPVDRTSRVIGDNPLGQVPTFFARDGAVLYDSRVICEYLDHVAGGGRIIPAAGSARWRALTEQALADGILDAGLLIRYEITARPEGLRWAEWRAGQADKMAKGLDRLEADAAGLGGRVDLGTISIGCMLGYLDFRYPDLAWRNGRPALAAWAERFNARPSMASTVPKG